MIGPNEPGEPRPGRDSIPGIPMPGSPLPGSPLPGIPMPGSGRIPAEPPASQPQSESPVDMAEPSDGTAGPAPDSNSPSEPVLETEDQPASSFAAPRETTPAEPPKSGGQAELYAELFGVAAPPRPSATPQSHNRLNQVQAPPPQSPRTLAESGLTNSQVCDLVLKGTRP